MHPETEMELSLLQTAPAAALDDAGSTGGSTSINVTLFLGVGTGVLFGFEPSFSRKIFGFSLSAMSAQILG